MSSNAISVSRGTQWPVLGSAKDRISVGPAIVIISRTLYEGELFGFTHEMAVNFGLQRILADSRKVYSELRKSGVRTLVDDGTRPRCLG
jgi:hypothetical protein